MHHHIGQGGQLCNELFFSRPCSALIFDDVYVMMCMRMYFDLSAGGKKIRARPKHFLQNNSVNVT